MPYKYNSKVIRAGRGWTDNDGVKHPTNWMNWSDAEKTAAGLVWEADPATYDNRFYWDANTPKSLTDVNEVDEDGNPVLDEDGNLVTKGLKTKAIETVKAQAGGLLAPTDWMVIKAAEVDGYTAPSDIVTYRAAVRAKSNDIEASINGAADLAAFMALYDTPVDADGNAIGNPPITDWPEQN